jgi:hypothetical protein
MTTANPTTAPPPDDSGFLARLMPNRAATRRMRLASIFMLVVTALFAVPTVQAILYELHARKQWPAAEGEVFSYETMTRELQAHQPGVRDRTVYYIEFQVEFDVPAAQCRTGTTWRPPHPYPCIGAIDTLPAASWADAQAWTRRHPLNSPARILYDPNGPTVRFADDPLRSVLHWDKIYALIGMTAFGLLLFAASVRRSQFLDGLPENYSAPVPPAPQESRPDELIDLKID